jgi:hypothetical protein
MPREPEIAFGLRLMGGTEGMAMIAVHKAELSKSPFPHTLTAIPVRIGVASAGERKVLTVQNRQSIACG